MVRQVAASSSDGRRKYTAQLPARADSEARRPEHLEAVATRWSCSRGVAVGDLQSVQYDELRYAREQLRQRGLWDDYEHRRWAARLAVRTARLVLKVTRPRERCSRSFAHAWAAFGGPGIVQAAGRRAYLDG